MIKIIFFLTFQIFQERFCEFCSIGFGKNNEKFLAQNMQEYGIIIARAKKKKEKGRKAYIIIHGR